MPKKTETAVTRHRTLWLSDLHLGSPGCKAARLVKFLRHNDCEQLYLVGDIFDGWKLKTRFYWTPDHTRVIKAILAKARRGTKVYYLTGNHDAFMRQFVGNKLRLGGVRLMHELVHTTADDRKLLVTHGDQFDAVMQNLQGLAFAGDFAYEALLKFSDRLAPLQERFGLLPGFSISAFIKTGVKGLVQYLSGFDEQVYYQCRRRGLHGVVCGHTHHAEVRPIRNGVTSYNCGDWVESCTALAEDARGHIRVIHAAPDRPRIVALAPRRVVAGPAPRQLRPAAANEERQTAA
ncbi:MAG: UDP-2,3-diacylglucosamine diphosphatase [Gammaproteobacteria bacterium]